MKKNSVTFASVAVLFAIAALSAGTACTSSKNRAQKNDTKSKEWDYERIRQAREAEDLNNQNAKRSTPGPDKTLDCAIVSESQMKRGKMGGCTPLDERAGYGAGQFCCPRE